MTYPSREAEYRKAYQREYRERNKERIREYERKRQQQWRLTCISAYGGKCVCCNETEEAFLTIDHIDGDGTAHRKELGMGHNGTRPLYRWLISNGFPTGFQILCANCQMGKERPEGCPHKR